MTLTIELYILLTSFTIEFSTHSSLMKNAFEVIRQKRLLLRKTSKGSFFLSLLVKVIWVKGESFLELELHFTSEGSFGVDGRPDSNPGRPREPVKFHVAMSRCTNWPPKLSTNMAIDYCTLNIQPCMIHFCVRSNTLIKMMCHTGQSVECTKIYD